MTLPTIDRTPLRAQLLATLRTGTADAGDVEYLWGDNAVPPIEEAVAPPLPYGILYDLPGTLTVEGVDGAQSDGALGQQVTVVGQTPLDTGTLADRARAALCSLVAVAVGPVKILRVESNGHAAMSRVGALFQSTESFTVYVSHET